MANLDDVWRQGVRKLSWATGNDCLFFGDCVVAMTHEIIKCRERDLQASGQLKVRSSMVLVRFECSFSCAVAPNLASRVTAFRGGIV
jgi:hypothetical protein